MSYSTPFSRFSPMLLPLGLILILSSALISYRYYNYVHHPKSIAEILLPVSPEEPFLAPNAIGVGLVVGSVYNFDPGKKTFDSDGWIWMTWSQEVDQQFKRKGMKPEELLFFFNSVNDYDFSLVPESGTPLRQPDGRYYQKYQFSGHFYVNDLNFRLYPFQTIKLPIALELKSLPVLGEAHPLTLILDHEHSGVGSYVEVAGYVSEGFTLAAYVHRYRNSHGEPGLKDGILSRLQARMEISYQRTPMAILIKLFLPLISVMTLLLLSILVPSSGWDVKLAIPPTVMLTLIFLQQTYQASLPELPYITFMDSLYNICYLGCLLIFGLYLWGSMEYHLAPEEERKATILHIHRVDRLVLVALAVFFVVGTALNWYALGFPWE